MNNTTTLTQPTESKIIYKLWQIVCYLPWVWLLLLTLFTIGVTIQVGHLPFYGNPDPKDTGVLSLFYFPIIIGIPILFASLPIWIILSAAIKWVTTYPFPKQDVIAYLLGIIICAGVAFSDFAGLLTWLAD